MPKLILDMNAMQEDFFAESSLIGLGTALPAYQLCWLLNQQFDLRFARDTEQNICLRKKDKQYIFPVYHFDIPNTYSRYLLYKLKNGSESLLPETRQLDYLWLVQTAEPEEDAHNILTSLKSIPDIQLSQILLPDQLKNLNNLLV